MKTKLTCLILFVCCCILFSQITHYQTNTMLFFLIVCMITYSFTRKVELIIGIALVLSVVLNQFVIREPMVTKKKKSTKDEGGEEEEEEEDAVDEEEEEEGNVGKKKSEGFHNQEPEPFRQTNLKKRTIDQTATHADNYLNLDKLLESGELRQLTDETKRLIDQQIALSDAVKSMSPLIQDAKKLVSS